MVKYELKRAFGRTYMFALLLGVASGIGGVFAYYLDSGYFEFEAVSCYEAWLFCLSLSEGSFYRALFPIIICIPYLGTFFTDRNSSFIHFIMLRTSYKKYLYVKLGVGILSTVLVVFSILVIWLVICALTFPSNIPLTDVNYIPGGALASFYQNNPIIYILLLTLLNILTAAVFFLASVSISFFVSNKRLVVIIPFVVYLFFVILSGFHPFYFLDPVEMFVPFENMGSTLLSITMKWISVITISGFGIVYSTIHNNREIL